MSVTHRPEWGGVHPYDEHWDPDDHGTSIGECERCGERRPLQLVEDPFVSEGISDPTPPEWWCYPCYEARADDV